MSVAATEVAMKGLAQVTGQVTGWAGRQSADDRDRWRHRRPTHAMIARPPSCPTLGHRAHLGASVTPPLERSADGRVVGIVAESTDQ